jgi:hypothetical protein
MTVAGFPHSGITGSKPACGSPMLFAAYHALHRLSVPRHPPCALIRLTGNACLSPASINRPAPSLHSLRLPAAYGCTPRSSLVMRLGLNDFSSASPAPFQKNDHEETRDTDLRIRIRTHTTHTQNSLPRFDSSRKRNRRFRCSPRPLLHTTLDPSCQINNPDEEREREETAERATCERFLHPEECLLACSRKEVIQPQVPLRLPCYDFAPVIKLAFGRCLLAVGSRTSGTPNFHGVTGGVYKARERIHRGVADPRLLAIPTSCSRVTDCNPNLDRVFPIRSASRHRFGLSRPL